MDTRAALILLAHGAREPDWARPFVQLRNLVADLRTDVQVELAFLDMMTPALPDLVAQLAAAGCGAVTIVPMFLGQGGHVLRDLPRLVADLRLAYPQMQFSVVEAVGEDASVQEAMALYCARALP